ncbi:cardiolipin synthase [Halobacillus salinarum]|uniref:Cardiolipin synthase n=1 Tax=Halobacillus salinarum TaxID=2932257 RepID=A0ABY4ET45_9BACI|nr:cardiolipin synthase [Halobacillus salinarum]UOQ45311.1 cardiolipin synthase [Halobacillus salinarum]
MGLLLAIFILIMFILLLIVDFIMGRKAHKPSAQYLSFGKSEGEYQLYQNGAPLFEDFFQDIAEAKEQIDVLFYLIDDSQISLQLLDLLKKKAEEGLPVRLMVDRLGGYKMDRNIVRGLRESGVYFSFSESPRFPFFFYKLNRRNHRKITVIDGKAAYVGGFNVGKNYIGENAKFGNWRDYHLRIVGPAVEDLHTIFAADWEMATGEKMEPVNSDHQLDRYRLRFAATDGVNLEEEFLQLIHMAEKEIFIGTPYFIPTEQLMSALEQALTREVKLHILVPLKADHPFVKPAAIPYLKRMKDLGAKISLFDAGFYHSKIFIIDEKVADIGTANFDRRSLFLNKEVNTFVYDPGFIKELKELFMKDAGQSIAFDEAWLSKRSLTTKINEKIAILLRPLL